MVEQRRVPHASGKDYERAFHGLEFPVAADEVRRHAADHGGLDREVLDVLERLPDESYDTLDDLLTGVRAVYSADGYAGERIPV
jgi:hypothetical protein